MGLGAVPLNLRWLPGLLLVRHGLCFLLKCFKDRLKT